MLFAQFEKYFPDLAKLFVLRNLSTPLSTASITGHHHGGFYGIDVTPDRVLSGALQAKTPVPGLILAGQDVLSPGIPGALWGGIFAAASVDPRVWRKLLDSTRSTVPCFCLAKWQPASGQTFNIGLRAFQRCRPSCLRQGPV
ncbi:MAG: hypothetical protein LJE62_11475 [Silicimonas sp.]|nr:hypothetical protein [Silicimonas sp.]